MHLQLYSSGFLCCRARKRYLLRQEVRLQMNLSSPMTLSTSSVPLLTLRTVIFVSLSSSRFLKTILARHAYGPLVLKIFIKPDAAMSLRVIQRRLKGLYTRWVSVRSANSPL